MKSTYHRIFLFLLVALFVLVPAMAQQTTGGIQGVVKDKTGAVLPGVSVTVTDVNTGRKISAVTDDSGSFVVRSLPATQYQVKAELQGFRTKIVPVTVQVGTVTTVSIGMEIGEITQVVNVQAESIRVNTATNTVSGVVTSQEIKKIPLNGRNFLDLAQVEPGVQLVDGGTFDPTKNQMTGVSIGGRSGRVTRIEVDGIDISDETVGTTVQNISADSMQEFQLSQSSLDPSTSLSSSGAVNIVTKSGTNEFHGGGFFYVRSNNWGTALPTTRTGPPQTIKQLETASFDREQGGGEVGGPIVRDKLFFFLNTEIWNQDGTTFINASNFPNFNGASGTPYDDYMGIGKLDWNINSAARAFYRFTTETNSAATGFGGTSLAPFVNQNVTNVHGSGLDIATATLTHSIRYGYLNFANHIGVNSLGLPEFHGDNGTPVSVAINSRRVFFSGPNRLAPQFTLQRNHQWKYDGSWVIGDHTLRYGTEITWIKDNVFASFFGVGPEVRLNFSDSIRQAIIDRGDDPNDPLQYPVSFAILGNGQGSFSEIANNGQKLGGINNTRIAWYAADSWRVTPTFILNAGVRYDVETGQVNDDLGLPSQLSGLLGAEGVKPTRLDKNNFGPQLGFAWQPFGNDRTVIRGGFGIYYETQIFNNSLFDRTDRLPAGLGFSIVTPPFSGINGAGNVVVGGNPVNGIDATSWSGQPLKSVLNQIAQTQADYQAASAAAGFDPNNPALVLNDLTTSAGPLFTQDFSTPYGIQTNIGFQHQFANNWMVSADFVRNRSVHANLVRDFNQRRAVKNFDLATAQANMQAALDDFGASTVDEAIAAGATFSDFAMQQAFGTTDPTFDAISVIMTSGISTYKALQIQTTGRFDHPFQGLNSLFMNISYSLSRFNGMGTDQDFLPTAAFNDGYFNDQNIGPAGLDRTHQLTATLFAEMPWGINLNLNQRWATALPRNVTVPQQVGGDAEIFHTDFDGEGTIADFLPGVKRGAFGRSLGSVSALNQAISNYNSSVAGTLTPAGQKLVQAGLFTEAQLKQLGAVAPTIPLAPSNQVMNDSFLTTDVRLSKTINVGGERVRIVPTFEVFNLFNVANYGVLSGSLTGSSGSINGTPQNLRTNLLGLGSGSFSQGIPRSVQFSIRVDF